MVEPLPTILQCGLGAWPHGRTHDSNPTPPASEDLGVWLSGRALVFLVGDPVPSHSSTQKSQPSEVLGTKPATKFSSQWLLLLPLLLSPCVYFGAQSEAALRHHRFEGKMLDRHMTCPHPALGAGVWDPGKATVLKARAKLS